MGRKSNMSAQSAVVIAQLRKLGAQSETVLLAAVSTDTPAQLKKRLTNLRDNGWLQVDTDAAGTRLWSIRPAARPLFPELAHPPCKKPAPAKEAQVDVAPPVAWAVATARAVQVMHGSYETPRASAGRPGAYDFMAIRSQGVRC